MAYVSHVDDLRRIDPRPMSLRATQFISSARFLVDHATENTHPSTGGSAGKLRIHGAD